MLRRVLGLTLAASILMFAGLGCGKKDSMPSGGFDLPKGSTDAGGAGSKTKTPQLPSRSDS